MKSEFNRACDYAVFYFASLWFGFISMIYLLIPYNIRIYHLPQKDDIRRNASEIVIKADSVITIADKIC